MLILNMMKCVFQNSEEGIGETPIGEKLLDYHPRPCFFTTTLPATAHTENTEGKDGGLIYASLEAPIEFLEAQNKSLKNNQHHH